MTSRVSVSVRKNMHEKQDVMNYASPHNGGRSTVNCDEKTEAGAVTYPSQTKLSQRANYCKIL